MMIEIIKIINTCLIYFILPTFKRHVVEKFYFCAHAVCAMFVQASGPHVCAGNTECGTRSVYCFPIASTCNRIRLNRVPAHLAPQRVMYASYHRHESHIGTAHNIFLHQQQNVCFLLKPYFVYCRDV